MHPKLKDFIRANYEHKTKSMHLLKSDFVVSQGRHVFLARKTNYNCANCDRKSKDNPLVFWHHNDDEWIGRCSCRKIFRRSDM